MVEHMCKATHKICFGYMNLAADGDSGRPAYIEPSLNMQRKGKMMEERLREEVTGIINAFSEEELRRLREAAETILSKRCPEAEEARPPSS